MGPYKELFDTYMECNATTTLIRNCSNSKIIRIGTIKVMMLDGIVRTMTNVKHFLKLTKILIFFGTLRIMGYNFSTKNNIMNINKGALIAIKRKKVKCFKNIDWEDNVRWSYGNGATMNSFILKKLLD